jgi:hypothetical protein
MKFDQNVHRMANENARARIGGERLERTELSNQRKLLRYVKSVKSAFFLSKAP